MRQFRPLLRGDIPLLIRMTRDNMAAIVHSSWGMEWTDEPLLEWLSDPDISTEVLEEDDEPIGYYSLEFVDNYVFVTSIQLRKDRQGCGYGELMMDRIEHMAIEKHIEGVELCVQETNDRAKSFYEHIGYDTVCRRGNNYLMRKRLL
ncbi:MAG TPA: GNAT family N-acetyltransferase [Methanomassiliicoccales archaeon]|nr:GNAT family N-acetyltransferase [Methanomassiliicoccales archaeon]